MILYTPTEGDIHFKKIKYQPKTCFVMTKLGTPVPNKIKNMRSTLKKYLDARGLGSIDANSTIRGKDFLMKIWEMIVSVPIGIAVISEELPSSTMANIFYEIGILQSLGKEILIIKTKECIVPSDFVRTEHIVYDKKFKTYINKYLDSVFKQAKYYDTMADLYKSDALLASDYWKRAYLITGDKIYKKKIKDILSKKVLGSHLKGSIQDLLDS